MALKQQEDDVLIMEYFQLLNFIFSLFAKIQMEPTGKQPKKDTLRNLEKHSCYLEMA